MKHRNSSRLLLFFLPLLFLFLETTIAAQDVNSIVNQMEAQYKQQLNKVKTYVVETNLHTSYFKRVKEDGERTYKISTKMKGNQGRVMSNSNRSTSTPYGFNYDALRKNAEYKGEKSINGTDTYVLYVKNPGSVMKGNNKKQGNFSDGTYYIDQNEYVPVRMNIKSKQTSGGKTRTTTVVADMKDYKMIDGVNYPHLTEIDVDLGLSESERKKMKRSIKMIENMPKSQREKMKQKMGGNFERMKKMLSDSKMKVKVKSVKVNVDLPDEAFSSKK